MSSPIEIEVKKEDQHRLIQPEAVSPQSPPEWNPNFTFSVPKLPVLQPVPSHSEVPVAKTSRANRSSAFTRPFVPAPDSPSREAPPHRFIPATFSPLEEPVPRPRVPRPPNAFMLFRSDFLKTGIIPANIERRQQNLSRIAGQMWNMLEPEKKAEWHALAAKVLSEHHQKNPDYKFTPAPRGSRRPKSKVDDQANGMAEDDIRRIRETYAKVMGPSPASNRRRRQKKARSVEASDYFNVTSFRADTGPSVSNLPPPIPFVERRRGQNHIPYSTPSPPPPVESLFRNPFSAMRPSHPTEPIPRATLPRRPSTSLGFTENTKKDNSFFSGNDASRPSSTRAPSPAASSNSIFGFIRNRGREIVNNLLPSSIASVTRSADVTAFDDEDLSWEPPTYMSRFGRFITPPICPSTSTSSPSIYSPSEQKNSYEESTYPLSAAYCYGSDEHAEVQHPAGGYANGGLYSSLGITDDVLSYLKPPFDVPSSDGLTQDVWLPCATDLERWNFQHQDIYNSSDVNFSYEECKGSE